MKIAEHRDLSEKYENPIPHACDMHVGQTFITDGTCRPPKSNFRGCGGEGHKEKMQVLCKKAQ